LTIIGCTPGAVPHMQGEHFSGWQKQQAHNGREFRTIEATLETVLGAALGQAVRFFPAGRTDAGVSAAGQCITFDAMLAPSSPVIAKPPKHLRGESLAVARYSFSDINIQKYIFIKEKHIVTLSYGQAADLRRGGGKCLGGG
jgi:tRNA pseudouridine(38-40) synthase